VNGKYETDPEKALAKAVKAGTDLECETCQAEDFMHDKYLPAEGNLKTAKTSPETITILWSEKCK